MKLFKSALFIGATILTLGLGVALGQHLFKTHRGGPLFAQGSDAPLNLASASGAAPAGMNFADVAEKVNHAVVAVTATEFVEAQPAAPGMMSPFDVFPFFGPGQGPHRRKPAPQQPPGGDEGGGENGDGGGQRQISGGSGFLITPDGYLLTNNHVIDNASKIEVQLENDKKYPAKLIGTDKETDIALLKIDGKDLPVAVLGESDKARVGEWVLAIGNPLVFSHTVTVGVLSAKGRKLDAGIGSFLQTDAAINFGNSGGPLVNARGEVIGINDAIIRNDEMGRTIEGIGFAIPINTAKQIVEELRSKGKVARGKLGVSVQKIQESEKKYYASKYSIKLDGAALVQEVQPNTPAAKAGMKVGDLIIEADGKPVSDSESLVKIIAGRKPGEKVRLKYYRNGEVKSSEVTLIDRSAASADDSGDEEKDAATPRRSDYEKRLGFKVEALDAGGRRELELEGDVKGVVIFSVSPRSNAYEAGLRQGSVITELNGAPVRTLDEFEAQAKKIKPGEPVSMILVRGKSQRAVYFDAAADESAPKGKDK